MNIRLPSLVAFILAVLTLGLACGDPGPEPTPVASYFDELEAPVTRATDAIAAYTRSADDLADTDTNAISAEDYRTLNEQHLEVVREAQRAARESLAEIRVIVPPAACEEIHATFVEALRLSEQGLLEIVSYLQTALRGVEPDENIRFHGNELLADADRAKEQGLIVMNRSPGCS